MKEHSSSRVGAKIERVRWTQLDVWMFFRENAVASYHQFTHNYLTLSSAKFSSVTPSPFLAHLSFRLANCAQTCRTHQLMNFV